MRSFGSKQTTPFFAYVERTLKYDRFFVLDTFKEKEARQLMSDNAAYLDRYDRVVSESDKVLTRKGLQVMTGSNR